MEDLYSVTVWDAELGEQISAFLFLIIQIYNTLKAERDSHSNDPSNRYRIVCIISLDGQFRSLPLSHKESRRMPPEKMLIMLL